MGPGRLGLRRGRKGAVEKPSNQASSTLQIQDEDEEDEQPSRECTRSNNSGQGQAKRKVIDFTIDSAEDGSDEENSQSEDLPLTRRFPKRGRTRNIHLANQRRVGLPMVISFDEHAERIVGRNSRDFINELGCMVRKMARFNKPNFHSQDEKLKVDMVANASDGFIYEDGPIARKIILKQLASQFKNAKYQYHRYFKKFSSKEEALKIPPNEDVQEDDWKFLCDHFDNTDHKKICEKNAKNRGKNKSPTTVGSRSIARMCEEKKEQTGNDMNPIEVYKESRYSQKKGAMINGEAAETLETMLTLQATTSLTPTEICSQTLGWIPGNQMRYKSKKSKSVAHNLMVEAERQKKRADDAEKKAESLAEEVQNLKDKHIQSEERIDSLSSEIAKVLQRLPTPQN